MKEKPIRKPVNPGRKARVPMVMQMEVVECGAACLDMVLGYYGRYVPLAQVRSDCGVSRDGSNMKSIALAAQNYGLEVKPFRYSLENLKTKATCPCILYWENNHFVVLTGYTNGRFHLNDPARGMISVSGEVMEAGYSGICLTFAPGASFRPGGERDSLRGFTVQRLRRANTMSVLVLLTTLILTLLGIVEPAFSRAFADAILPGFTTKELTRVFFMGYGLMLVIRVLVLWYRSAYLVKLEGKMAIYSGSSFIWHLLRLPMEFFSQRHPGDILKRYDSNKTVTSAIVMRFAPLFLDFLSLIFYAVIMLCYSPVLAGLCILSVAASIALSVRIAAMRLNLTRVRMKNTSLLSSTSLAGLSMIETLKATGSEEAFFSKWAGLQARVTDEGNRLESFRAWLDPLPELISSVTDCLILCIGICLMIRGEWSVGLISAFTGYLAAFSAPAEQLVSALQTLQETRGEMERINDIMDYPTDLPEAAEPEAEEQTCTRLTGDVELRHVTFGYNRLREPLIRDFSLRIRPGASVALVGGSGSGKSTLAWIMSGLSHPWEGEVLYDGRPIGEIDRNVFTASVSVVDQQISLFRDTVYNNISMWDRTVPEDAVIGAARSAEIYDTVIVRENGLMAPVTDGGSNFSGGERQRIEIARALASEPSVLIMDEATSALDAETEFRVMKAVRQRKITTVVISHRLSTVRDCDEIIVLHKGEVVDRGTHSELMDRCRYYADMITSE